MKTLVLALGIMSILVNFSAQAASNKKGKAKSSSNKCESLSMDECRDTPGCTPSGGRGEKSCLVDSDDVDTVEPAVVCDLFAVGEVVKGNKDYCHEINFQSCGKMSDDMTDSQRGDVIDALRICKVDK